MGKEWLARAIVVLGLGIVITITAIYHWQPSRAIVVHAQMAETGGWMPNDLTVAVGEPLHLRLVSDDVTHGFVVGKLDQPVVDVNPGEITDITLVFKKPGKYTFYCTRWCSPNHWRMRGTIEVTDPLATPEPASSPLYVRLGLDIDANHQTNILPPNIPSARRGAALSVSLPQEYTTREYYLAHAPVDLFQALRADVTSKGLSDQQLWDLVAWVWQTNTSQQEVQAGKQLYIENCAACHGEGGAGNGVLAAQPFSDEKSAPPTRSMLDQANRLADFTDQTSMLSASPARLQGKIIRGGMGSGMPSWGAIFTENQTWALVAYLWTFQFESEVYP